jgi:hypothetical protein
LHRAMFLKCTSFSPKSFQSIKGATDAPALAQARSMTASVPPASSSARMRARSATCRAWVCSNVRKSAWPCAGALDPTRTAELVCSPRPDDQVRGTKRQSRRGRRVSCAHGATVQRSLQQFLGVGGGIMHIRQRNMSSGTVRSAAATALSADDLHLLSE